MSRALTRSVDAMLMGHSHQVFPDPASTGIEVFSEVGLITRNAERSASATSATSATKATIAIPHGRPGEKPRTSLGGTGAASAVRAALGVGVPQR